VQYGLAAAEEALEDAGWKPIKPEDLEGTVRHCKVPVRCCANLSREFVWDPGSEISKSSTILRYPTKQEYDWALVFLTGLVELTYLAGLSQDSSSFCTAPVDQSRRWPYLHAIRIQGPHERSHM
jgi:hypothetical protein